jgi:3-carboxy-cis,cis-muconate cycloisomerase
MAFAALFVPDDVREAVSDGAWLEAMLDAERALAKAAGLAGLLDATAADAVAEACDPSRYDSEALLREGRTAANPVEPLVRALRAAAPEAHRGATSQDILDTAAMLVARRAIRLILESLATAGDTCAELVDAHRRTPMAARTLLQQAVPTTFGALAGNWLVQLAQARDRLEGLSFPAQLGGAAGTLAAFGDRGLDVAARLAAELELAHPPLPWHTNRAPVAEIAFALEQAAAAAAKIGLDVVLLAQTEIGEVRETAGGASSTMPHKQNPARAVLARACARGVHAQATLLRGGGDELQRAAGAWQAEWNALSESLALCGGAVAAIRDCLAGLEVDAEAMRGNMRETLYSERDRLGLDGSYLGATSELAERALAAWRR